jgi:hypothetical protein
MTSALRDHKHEIARKHGNSNLLVILSLDSARLKPECYATAVGRRSLTIAGGDERGVIYGALSVAEQLRNGVALKALQAKTESAALPFRAIKFNLPWDSYRSSSALDLHYDTAGCEVLTVVPRHDGREPVQCVDAVPLHDPS